MEAYSGILSLSGPKKIVLSKYELLEDNPRFERTARKRSPRSPLDHHSQ